MISSHSFYILKRDYFELNISSLILTILLQLICTSFPLLNCNSKILLSVTAPYSPPQKKSIVHCVNIDILIFHFEKLCAYHRRKWDISNGKFAQVRNCSSYRIFHCSYIAHFSQVSPVFLKELVTRGNSRDMHVPAS